MAYGVTPQGFVRKPLDVCLAELKAAVRATFGQGQDVDDPAGPWGQLLGIVADRESELWDMGQALHAARDPDQATGSALEAICAITGTNREQATRSTLLATLTGSVGTVIPEGKVASVSGTGVRFRSTADATIGAGGSVENVPFEAEETGPKIAPSGTLTVIETPVSGWTGVSNPIDATPGRDREQDGALRIRRVDELAVAATATPDAVRAEVLRVEDVTACTVFENTTSSTDGNGLPAKSIEVLATGGADADIRSAIWKSRASGIETYGSVSGTVLDSQGVSHTVKFSRPTPRNVYVRIIGTKDESKYPADGDAQLKAQLVAWGLEALLVGVAVVAWQMKKVLGVSGLTDVSALYIGFASNPTSEATLSIGSREQAVLDTSRISVELT